MVFLRGNTPWYQKKGLMFSLSNSDGASGNAFRPTIAVIK